MQIPRHSFFPISWRFYLKEIERNWGNIGSAEALAHLTALKHKIYIFKQRKYFYVADEMGILVDIHTEL